MTVVVKSVLVPYSCQEMFDLVANIEAYPAFLPWCGGSSVQTEPDGSILAEVVIAFKGVQQRFTTRNENQPHRRIDMRLHKGPFQALAGHFEFLPIGEERACRIQFNLEYQFSSKVLEKLIGPVFNAIAQSFVDAFVTRAEALYSDRPQQTPRSSP
ncbi:MAG: hypothetical protein RL617_286 [Pseudomonadota bacterium]